MDLDGDSNTAAIMALKVPTMTHRILIKKLGFLHRVIVSNPASLRVHVIQALCDNADFLHLVKEWKELEEWFGSTFTDIILSESLGSMREIKKEILEFNKKKCSDRCFEKAPMVAEVM